MNALKDSIFALSHEDRATLQSLIESAVQLDEQRLTLQVAGRDSMPVDRVLLHEARLAHADGRHLRTEQALQELTASRPDLAQMVDDVRALASQGADPQKRAQLATILGALGAKLGTRTAEADADAAAQRRDGAMFDTPPTPPELANEILADSVSAALSAKPDPRAVPGSVASRYLHENNEFRPLSAPHQVAFVDRGAKLQTNADFDGATIKAMVDVAEARGWSSLKVTGSEAFRRAAWYEATTRGLAVVGYKPTEAEQDAARAAGARNGTLNRIEANPAVEAFLAAKTGEERTRAASRHPELAAAFAHLEAHRRFADARMTQSSREAYVELQRQHLARDIASGVKLPAVDLRARAARQPTIEYSRG